MGGLSVVVPGNGRYYGGGGTAREVKQEERALALGQDNERALLMLRNHCLHARPTISVSPYGREVGLPIGPAEIACDHAAFFGMSGIDLMSIAVEFYESRCVECPYRMPTGQLPTIGTEAERRRAEQKAQELISHERQAALESQRQTRSEARDTAIADQPYTVRDLAAHIKQIDKALDSESEDQSQESRRRIVEIARLSPEHFVSVLIDDLERLARADDATALEALRELASHGSVSATRVADIAADVLSTGANIEAGKIVAQFAAEVSKEKIPAASLGAIALASDWDAAFPAPRRPANPASAIALAHQAWELFYSTLSQELNQDNDWRREAGCHAARYVLTDSALRVGELVGPVLSSMRGEDSGYAGNPAPGAAAVRSIAAAWIHQPRQCRDAVEQFGENASKEVRELLICIPRFLERAANTTSETEEQVIGFLMHRLDGDWGAVIAADASHELIEIARKKPQLLSTSTPALVGSLISACETPSPTALHTLGDPRLKYFEDMADRQQRGFLRRNIADILGQLGVTMTAEVFDACSTVLAASTGSEEQDRRVRVAFLKVLEAAATPQTVSKILPQLYSALLSSDALLRATAIELWRACARAASTLPAELAELAERLMTDTYVIVHDAMIVALPYLRLPDTQIKGLLGLVFAWAATYAKSEDARNLERALDTLLWGIDRLNDAWQPQIASFVIEVSTQLSAMRREDLLLRSALLPYRETEIWAKAALEVLAATDRHEVVVSPRDDRLLAALIQEPGGLKKLPLELFQSVVARHGIRFLHQRAEMIELLQSVGRWSEAERLAEELLDAVPRTKEYESRREWAAFLKEAVSNERLSAEGLTPRLNVPPGEETSALRIHVRQRSVVRNALRTLPLENPATAARALRDAAKALAASQIGRPRVDLFAEMLSIAEHLVEYDASIREAAGPTQHLAAARRLAQLLQSHTAMLASDDIFAVFAKQVVEASALPIDDLLSLVRQAPLPLPLCPPERPTYTRSDEGSTEPASRYPLVVCGIRLNGEPISIVSVLYQDTIPDLSVTLRLSEWPSEAKECRVEFLSTFPADALSWPSFSFGPGEVTKDSRGLTVTKSGHLNLTAKRPPGAAPIELRVHIQFIDGDGRATVASVAGHERLLVRPYDPTCDTLTSHRPLDQRLHEMFADLTLDASIDQRDQDALFRFFAACVRAAREIMFDKLIKAGGRVTEKQFHDRFEKLLLSDEQLGGRVTRRDPVAGGFDDLMHDDIVAELKVERKHPRTPADCHSYIGQPTQYGVGRGSRLSILVVLDQTAKELPPAVLDNGVAWMFPRVHGYDDPRYPSRVAVLVIPGNWKTPSSWSRRKIPTAKPSR